MSADLPALNETLRWNGGTWKVERLREDAIELREILKGERQVLSTGEWLSAVTLGIVERRARPPLTRQHAPRRGAFMRWNDIVWKVTVIRGGILNLQDADTDESGSIALRDWQLGCFEGDIEMLADRASAWPERTKDLATVQLADLPASMKAPADNMLVFIEAWKNPHAFYDRHFPDLPPIERKIPRFRSVKHLTPFLALVAETTGAVKPGCSTFCKWLADMEEANGDVRAAVPRHDRKGPHKPYMNPRVEQWLNDAIDKFWLQNRKNKKRKVHEELESKVAAWNLANPTHPVHCPSVMHVCRYTRDTVDKYVAARRRGNDEEIAAADRQFAQVGAGPATTFILERVEVDHTFVSLRIKDDKTGVILGCPWITAAIDHYSGMPVAAHVNFENQSMGASLQCLKMLMTPKGFLPKLVPDLDYEYPCGVPYSFYFDHGSDFDSVHTRRVGVSLDIGMDYEPVECPEYKGRIERWWRTLKEEVVHPIPGAKLPGQRNACGIDPDGEAYMTYSEFVRRLWEWMTLVYAKSYHRGLNDIPLNRWLQSQAVTNPRALRKKDDLNVILNRVEKSRVSREGVTYDGLKWIGPELSAIMANPAWREDMEVDLRISEFDYSQAWVVNPFTGRSVALEPKDKAYMTGLSKHAHDLILKRQAKVARGTLTTDQMRKTREKLRNEEARLIEVAKNGKRPVGGPVAKSMGVGRYAPSGDDLGSVLAHPSVEVEPLAVPEATPAVPDPAPPDGPNRLRPPVRRFTNM